MGQGSARESGVEVGERERWCVKDGKKTRGVSGREKIANKRGGGRRITTVVVGARR